MASVSLLYEFLLDKRLFIFITLGMYCYTYDHTQKNCCDHVTSLGGKKERKIGWSRVSLFQTVSNVEMYLLSCQYCIVKLTLPLEVLKQVKGGDKNIMVGRDT